MPPPRRGRDRCFSPGAGRLKKSGSMIMEADGYALDDKRTFTDGRGDTPDIIEQFRKRWQHSISRRK